MKVLDSRVMLQVEKSCTQKIGDIEIPVGVGEYEKATVTAVGPDIKEEHLTVGDVVYIYPNAGKKVNIDGVEYRVVTTNEIIVIL